MAIYLHDIPLDEARRVFWEALAELGLNRVLGEEEIPLTEQASGRTLAGAVWAKLSSPHYHASAMDGFAISSEDTLGAQPTRPLTLPLGERVGYVDTGDPLPGWANAVVPIENVESLDDDGMPASNPRRPACIRLRATVTPWSHVRPMGEDIVASQLILPEGHVIRPVDLGAIAAAGHDRIRVARQPRVAILPTGTELVPVGQPVKAGEVIEFNSLVLAAQVNRWGGQAERYAPVADDLAVIGERIQHAARGSDLVLVNAGSSAGSEDFTARAVESLGRLLVHGVAVRPGHPVILGMVKDPTKSKRQVPVIGVPGYPVSAALTGEIFIEPLIATWLGRQPQEFVEVEATLTRKVTSPPGDDDYLRVVAGRVGDRLLVAPVARGAGVITSLVRADGIVVVPRGIQGIEAGVPVRVRLYIQPQELERTIFATGSHDMTLDLLAQALSHKGRRLVSSNVGSQGGLVALRRNEAHLAGSHLLDTESGEYNVPFIRQYLPGQPVLLVTWAWREQGLMVQPGNPRLIKSLADLLRQDVRFINRQRGSGTRVLLDYHLKRSSLDSGEIRGYEQEEYTHLAVAAGVASGRADCGLGVTAAARALGLGFIPLFLERYDLVIPGDFAHSQLIAPVFDLMADLAFRQSVAAMPGYDITEMGRRQEISPG